MVPLPLRVTFVFVITMNIGLTKAHRLLCVRRIAHEHARQGVGVTNSERRSGEDRKTICIAYVSLDAGNAVVTTCQRLRQKPD